MSLPPLPKLEEEILHFWRENQIFEKSLAIRRRAKPFRFFEGPPTANAAPGFHHVIARAFKDIICRYKTMQGFYVERKAGWDTHGLPVELQIEKELGFKTKSDIEKYGISRFNKKAKDSVWRYKEEWERFTERLGFWLDLKHPYITYETPYMETLWWIIKRVFEKGLLEEDFKVVPWCPRCETPLSSHEVAQGYEDVAEESVYVRFPVKAKTKEWENTSILSWTTTPWTLPGNVALAVDPDEDYVCIPDPEKEGSHLVLGKKSFEALQGKGFFPTPYRESEREVFKGKEMVGVSYESLFGVTKLISGASHKVYPASFVTMEEGTGVVHTAVMYGEDDFALGRKYNLPKHHTVDEHGRFTKDVPQWEGRFVKEVEKEISQDLERRGLLFKRETVTHTYPFCWRCHTPLLYYAHRSWFIRMSKLRRQLLSNNRKINWVPAHLKEGRFGEWLREVKDWAFSRERYWGTPLPVWVCEKCGKKHVVGSLEELSGIAFGKNTFFRMRHGGADHVVKGYIAGWPERGKRISHLTEEGTHQVLRSGRELRKYKIDLIVSSDLTRMKETVALLKKHLKTAKVIYEPRLREYNTGTFNYGPSAKFHKFFVNPVEKFTTRPPEGETLTEACARYLSAIKELDENYHGKSILILGHGDPLWALEGKLRGLSPEEIVKSPYPKLGRWEKLPVTRLPRDESGEVDLHRPFVDEFYLSCPRCTSRMKRVPYVMDVWYDSGAMPFSQWHWPFENKERVEKGKNFPADYIAEAVDQTRGWFYTLLAVSTLLGKGPAYLNVISSGHVLDEKGEKMSKSKGNVVDPWEMFSKYGADSLRWYFFTINPPGEPKKFAERDLKISAQDLVLLLNVLNFWETYAPEKLPYARSRLALLDRWILVRTNEMTFAVTRALDRYETREAALEIKTFLDDLSRWYVRRSRPRFQKPDTAEELESASRVLAEVLACLSRVLAPFTPFVAETVWRRVTPRLKGNVTWRESVHLERWPKANAPSQKENTLLLGMREVRKLASLSLALRAEAGIKVRQPLPSLSLVRKRTLPAVLLEILKDETNVKEIKIVTAIPSGERIVTSEEEGETVALDTALTPELKEEGIVRELLRVIQETRHALGLHPRDTVHVSLLSEGELDEVFRKYAVRLRRESRAERFLFQKPREADITKEFEIDGQKGVIGLQKVK